MEASVVHQRLRLQTPNSRKLPQNSKNRIPRKTIGICRRSRTSSWRDLQDLICAQTQNLKIMKNPDICYNCQCDCWKVCEMWRKLRPNLWRDPLTEYSPKLQILKTISSIIIFIILIRNPYDTQSPPPIFGERVRKLFCPATLFDKR